MLTAVSFADGSNGWAVGHGGVVLATHDGGESWALVHSAGADVSLLSVWFADATHGIAVGAFGFAIETGDGGKTWKRIPVGEGEGEDGGRHFQTAIRPDRGSYTAVVEAPGGRAILAGRSGVLDAEQLGNPGK